MIVVSVSGIPLIIWQQEVLNYLSLFSLSIKRKSINQSIGKYIRRFSLSCPLTTPINEGNNKAMQPQLSGEHLSGRHMSGHFCPGEHLSRGTFVRGNICPGEHLSGEHLSGYVSSGLGMVTTCLPKARDGHHMSA